MLQGFIRWCNCISEYYPNSLDISNVLEETPPELSADIIEKGIDRKYGARPLKRAIQTMIEDRLAEEILSGRAGSGDRVRITCRKGELVFE